MKNSLNIFTKIRKTITLLLLTGCMLSTSGCFLLLVGAAVGAGAVTVAYVDGVLNATYGYNYDKVVAATKEAITQLGFAQPEERKDELSDKFSTHTAKGDSVTITVTRDTDTATKVAIRVGAFGDEQMSMSINDKIKANLQ